jgi:hypothetical protein
MNGRETLRDFGAPDSLGDRVGMVGESELQSPMQKARSETVGVEEEGT